MIRLFAASLVIIAFVVGVDATRLPAATTEPKPKKQLTITPTDTPTNTPVTPTDTPTNTPVTPTDTATATSTPTATMTPTTPGETREPVTPTSTPPVPPTDTTVPPVSPTATSTATSTSVPPPGLDAPTNLTARAISTTMIDVAWNWTDSSTTLTTAEMFVVEYSMDGSAWYPLEPFGENETRFRFTGLTAGTTYYFRVKAVNEAGDSAYSNTASATTPLTDQPAQYNVWLPLVLR